MQNHKLNKNINLISLSTIFCTNWATQNADAALFPHKSILVNRFLIFRLFDSEVFEVCTLATLKQFKNDWNKKMVLSDF